MSRFFKIVMFCCLFSGSVFAKEDLDPKIVIEKPDLMLKMSNSELKALVAHFAEPQYMNDVEVEAFFVKCLMEHFKTSYYNPFLSQRVNQYNKMGRIVEEFMLNSGLIGIQNNVFGKVFRALAEAFIGLPNTVFFSQLAHVPNSPDRDVYLDKWQEVSVDYKDVAAQYHKFLNAISDDPNTVNKNSIEEPVLAPVVLDERFIKIEKAIKSYTYNTSNGKLDRYVDRDVLTISFLYKISNELQSKDENIKNRALSFLDSSDLMDYLNYVGASDPRVSPVVLAIDNYKQLTKDSDNGKLVKIELKGVISKIDSYAKLLK